MQPKPLELAYSTGCFAENARLMILDDGGPDAARMVELFVTKEELDSGPELSGALVRSGTACWSLHAPFGEEIDLSSLDDEVRRAAREACHRAAVLAAELGAPIMVAHAGAEPVLTGERAERLAWSREGIASVAEVCRDLGLRLAIEFLPRTCPGNRVDELTGIIEDAGTGVGVCLDVNHANLGQDLVANVLALGERIVTVHMSDNDGIDERHWLPGQGVIDWAALVAALRRTGYGGPFLYESGTDRAGGVVTPSVLRANYRCQIEPLLGEE